MKVVIVGGSAGGASVAARLRRLNENAKIVILEKSTTVSFATCGVPYYLGGIIADRNRLQVVDPEEFSSILNVRLKTESEVIAIDPKQRSVSVKDVKTDIVYQEKYDKLVLSPGAKSPELNIPGTDSAHVFTLRSEWDADEIKSYIEKNQCTSVAVVGAGFIGMEAAENLAHLGLDVSVISRSEQILSAWDYEMANKVQYYLHNKGVKLYTNTMLTEISGRSLSLSNGNSIEADLIILATGVKPDVVLAHAAGLTIGDKGGIQVNAGLYTSDDNIFALGDAIEVHDKITLNKVIISLAGQAHKQARIVAENICNRHATYHPSMGTAIVKIFNMSAAVTGSTEKQLLENGIGYQKTYIEAPAHASFYPNSHNMLVKLLFAARTGRVLGAQIVGMNGVDKRIDVIATGISMGATVSDLKDLDLAYAPPFSAVKDPVHVAGTVAHNMINKEFNFVHWDELDMFDEKNTVLVDVRTPDEFDIRTIESAKNIPLTVLRERLHELQKDKRIIFFCQFGKKGYFACKMLQQLGYQQVFNLVGGLNTYMLGNSTQNSFDAAAEPINPRLNVDLDVDNEEEVPFYDLDNIYPLRPEISVSTQDDADFAKMFFNPDTIDQVSEVNEAAQETVTIIEVDASGLSCPGPILQLTKTVRAADIGDIIKIKATDGSFSSDVKVWCLKKGHKLLEFDNSSPTVLAVLQKC